MTPFSVRMSDVRLSTDELREWNLHEPRWKTRDLSDRPNRIARAAVAGEEAEARREAVSDPPAPLRVLQLPDRQSQLRLTNQGITHNVISRAARWQNSSVGLRIDAVAVAVFSVQAGTQRAVRPGGS